MAPGKRPRRMFLVLGLLILLLVLVFTLRHVGPAAPREIVIFSGEPGTGYHDYGKQYVEFLGKQGITVHLVDTKGSLDNLHRLASEERAAVGFVQTGVERELESPEMVSALVSLGSLSFEPFWVFARKGESIDSIRDLAGRRVALGPHGSGSRATALQLLKVNGIEDEIEIAQVNQAEDLEKLLSTGRVDAICVIGEPRSNPVMRLLKTETFEPLSLPLTTAYARRHPGLEELVLPQAAADVAGNIPAADLNLVAPATNLVAGPNLPPAVIAVLLGAATEIHRPASLFANQGTFPSTKYVSLPLSPAAVQFFEQGPGILQRFLPYWLASLLT